MNLRHSFPPPTILVPTDFSKFSDNALKQAIDIAKQHKAKIYLLHVISVMQQCSADYCLDNATVAALEKKSVKSSEDMMKKQIKRVMKTEEAEVIPDVKQGIPFAEILKEQAAKKIDLIVIASHGRTGLLGHLIGSVSDKVMKNAACPVLLVRAK